MGGAINDRWQSGHLWFGVLVHLSEQLRISHNGKQPETRLASSSAEGHQVVVMCNTGFAGQQDQHHAVYSALAKK